MDRYLTQDEIKIIFGRGCGPIIHTVPSELVTENDIMSNSISLLELYINFLNSTE